MSDMRVYNRALTADEIGVLYRGEDSVTMGGASDSGSDGEVVNNDIDGDGVPNDQDAFPEDAAASVDADGDGYPDAWNDGYSAADSTTGLTLDIDPSDADVNMDTSNILPEFASDKAIKSQGLIGWYSVTSASIHMKGDKVKRWTNMISNGYNFRQSKQADMPHYDKTENAIHFEGAHHMMLDRNKPSDSTIIIVLKGSGDAYGDSSTYMHFGTGQAHFGSGEDQDSAIATTDDKISTTQRGIYVLKSSGSGNEVRIGHRSVFSRALSKIRRAADAFYIGKSGRSGGVMFNGHIYEILIYDNMLSENELSTITDELALRWEVESVKAKEITVQADFTGDTKGTRARPFKLFRKALDRIFEGGRIKVKKGHYNEKLKINQKTVIEAEDGPVILGTPKASQNNN